MVSIAQWLEGLGLGRYAAAFAANDIDWDTIHDLSESDLEKLGVSLGHRKKLLKAIAAQPQASTGPSWLAPSPSTAPAAERRQVTVMFCDLVGSTELSRRLDPEDLQEIIRAYQECCREVVAAAGGQIAKYLGDGILVYFGYPRAQEDDAERAVRAGLGVVDAVARLRTSSLSPLLQVRVGIATGAVVVGDLIGTGAAQEQAIVGETPNLAARMQQLAEPNTVVIAAGTHRLVGGLFECLDLGQCVVKGYAQPIGAWRVIGESEVESRFAAQHRAGLTPLVGREHSLGLLLDRWERAQQGEGQVVLISGEPGVGKSRLVEAVRERLADQPCTHMRYFCSPHRQDSALHPFIAQLERAAGIARSDTNESRLDKLERLLDGWTGGTQAVAPLFAALLSISPAGRYPPLRLTPQRQKESTLEAFVDLLARLAAQQPVLMTIDDVHWLDPTSLELLDLVVPRVKDLSVLLIIAFRPEFAPPWSGYAHVSTLPLARLGRQQSSDLAARVAGNKPLSEDVIGQIVGRAEGVPLFVEELTKAWLAAER
jgi:class 3 adenylate cyclase